MSVEHKFNHGSEWHKWDLHIHTPLSIDQDYGGEAVFGKFISALEHLPTEVKVIGITDYYFIDGYEKVMQYKNKGHLQNIEKIFPILEFRIDTFGSNNENNLSKINLHILFDIDESNLENEIKKIKEEFIGLIPITNLEKYSTKKLSKENFITIAGSLKSGFDSFIPCTKTVFRKLQSATWKEKVFLFAGYKEWSNLDKNNQLKPNKQDIYDKVDAFFSASPENNFMNCKRWLDEFGTKALLHSQDIHNFNVLDTYEKDDDGQVLASKSYCCNTWIKADRTFKGLKQIICEPVDRVRIQKTHPEDRSSYNIIDRIELINNGNDKVFSEVPIGFNPSLNAIIGGKSSGKSLLLHFLAHKLGNENAKYTNYSNIFEKADIKIYFKNDKQTEIHYEDKRIIEFLPQLFIEDIVREQIADNKNNTKFNEFIQKLLFEDKELTGKIQTFNETINSLQIEIERKISEWCNLDNILQIKRKELIELGDKLAIQAEIEVIEEAIEDKKTKAGWTQEELNIYNQKISEKDELEKKISLYTLQKSDFERLMEYLQNSLMNDILSSFNFYSNIIEVQSEVNEINSRINTEISKIVTESFANCQQVLIGIEENLKNTEQNIANVDTVLLPLLNKTYLQAEIENLNLRLSNENAKIKLIEEKELEISMLNDEINKIDILSTYNNLGKSYFDFANIVNNSLTDKWDKKSLKIEIKVHAEFNTNTFDTVISDIVNMKSHLINQFPNCGFVDGNIYYYTVSEHIRNLENLYKLATDSNKRFTNFKYGKSTKEFLTAIFKDCYYINYDVIKGNDSLKNMSEGKKGIAILQIYLSLSKSEYPILIDQPEDNLDNRTIYEELNTYIKKSKLQRQIIMVSHNANLVVNTDAENIIVANQSGEDNKQNKAFRFEYINGSLENTFENQNAEGILGQKGIREHVCEILEGGIEAFQKREEKYYLSSRKN